MRNAILSLVALAALAVTAGTAEAQYRTWYRSNYASPNYYYSPRFVYPGASYYSGYYPGYYGGYYGGNYYQPRGLSISWSPGFGLNVGYGSGYSYPAYGSVYSPWYGSSYYRGWRW